MSSARWLFEKCSPDRPNASRPNLYATLIDPRIHLIEEGART